MNTALLLIDIQNDYFEDGKFPLYKPTEAGNNAKILLNYFRQNSMPIIHIQHVKDDPKAPFFVKGTEGVHIHSLVQPIEGEPVVIKSKASSFHHTNLQSLLQEKHIDHLVICGMMSHHCVDSTVRTAAYLNYKITVIHDACTTRSLEFNEQTLDAPTVHSTFMAGMKGFGQVTATNAFITK